MILISYTIPYEGTTNLEFYDIISALKWVDENESAYEKNLDNIEIMETKSLDIYTLMSKRKNEKELIE